MQVSESSWNNLVQGQKQFQVPLYQRQYAWAAPELRQFWADVLDQYDVLTPLEGQTLAKPGPSHFLGSMVLAPSPKLTAAGVTAYLVIDGQQRLTTLFLALCALRDEMALSEPKATERINEIHLVNRWEKGTNYYRLLPTQSDRDSFFACVKGESSGQIGAMGAAYRLFRAELTQPGPDGEPLDLARVETVLTGRLQFVAITTDQHDNVHRIFESLNNRGVRLTQADLLRNYVFMLLPTRAEEVYEEVWRPMQESLTPGQLESLVFVDLILHGNPTVKRPDLYRAQQDLLEPIEGNEAAVEAAVRTLAKRAKVFKRIVQPDTEPNPKLREAALRLDRWGATTSYPLLLHCYECWVAQQCTEDELLRALSYVESFLVRRMIVGVPLNNLNRIFSSIVGQLRTDCALDEAVREALSGERRYWPSDRRLREAFRSQAFYYQGRQEQKMLVFQRLNASYGHPEPVDWNKAKLTIEHIMPQTLTDEWRKALAEDGSDPDEVHESLLHTLGNLTVTASNAKLSNSPFERKKDILAASHLDLNHAVVPENAWGRTQILTRADDLADLAIAIWPAPLPVQSEPAAGFDWSRLHAALAALPEGRWTSYGDLAELIGSHANPVGSHISSTPALANAYRVLTAEGKVSPGFHWDDPEDERNIHEVLAAEGIEFGADGRAASAQRLRANDLAALIAAVLGSEGGEDEAEADYGWRFVRQLRYLRAFYEAQDSRLHEDQARALALEEGYDPRGVAGFYVGANAKLRRVGEYRVLTDAGRHLFEENRHLLTS